jgi:hypothetical protein
VLTAALTTFVLVALALLTLALAVGARRAQRMTAVRAASLDDGQRADRIAEALRRSRARLDDLQAGSERTLWALTRLDERVDATQQPCIRGISVLSLHFVR